MSTECTCDPCTAPHDEHVGIGCFLGCGIESFDYDCPIPGHAELAIAQHGPRNQQEGQT